MAQAFLETDFLLRRATPTPARAQAPAASRPAFTVRDPEPNRARSQDTRLQTTRNLGTSMQGTSMQGTSMQGTSMQGTADQDTQIRNARTQEARTQDRGAQAARTRDVRPDTVRSDVSGRSERPSAPERAARHVPASSGRATRDQFGAAPAGATGAPAASAAMVGAGTVNEAGNTKETDGTEEDGDTAEASTEESDASLLALGFLPPPPPKSPVLQATQSSTAEGEASANPASSSSGPAQPSAGALKPSQDELIGMSGQEARPVGAAMAGKADPAVTVQDAKAVDAEIALPEDLSPVRDSFDSMLAGASAAPAAAAQTTPTTATQTALPTAPPVPLGAVPMTIGLRSLQGSNHFEIRLDPGDLGRIDVRLDIDKERGTVVAHLVVDRVETLALLQRDTGSLQQSLSQAGLDASEANITFSLRSDTQSGGQGADGQGSDGHRPEGRPGGPGLPSQPEGRAALAPVPLRTLRGLTGLDIRI